MKASLRMAWTALGLVLAVPFPCLGAEAAPAQPALHDALLALDKQSDTELDNEHLHRLKFLIAQYGWPTVKSAGRDGVDAIGDLLVRAGADENFQGDGEQYYGTRIGIDIDPLAYAVLNDRIEVAHGRPQQFGSLLTLDQGKVVTSPTTSAKVANGYRDSIGLPFLDTYLKQVQAALDDGKPLTDAAATPRLSTELHPVTNPQLRSQLHEMVASEQVARNVFVMNGMREGSPEFKHVAAIDAAHLPRIKAIFDKVGFPDAQMVGRSGVSNFFILVQHADADPAFQAKVLEEAAKRMRAGELSRQQYALMTDRVLIAQGKPQRYGSQIQDKDGHSIPLPTEDLAHVDERRAAMALEPLADYLKETDAMYAPAASTTSH